LPEVGLSKWLAETEMLRKPMEVRPKMVLSLM
jgi:hypothetical protein